jgi:hypothetical protein
VALVEGRLRVWELVAQQAVEALGRCFPFFGIQNLVDREALEALR